MPFGFEDKGKLSFSPHAPEDLNPVSVPTPSQANPAASVFGEGILKKIFF